MENEHVVPATSEPTGQPTDKKGSNKKILIPLGFIIFLLIIGSIFYFVGRSQNPQSEVASVSTENTNILTQPNGNILIPTVELSPTIPLPTSTPALIPATTTSKELTLSSSANLDGFRSSNNGGNTTLDIRAGRNINLLTRGFVSFELSDIPAGATIQNATLRLYQVKKVGDPFGVNGALQVDQVNISSSLGSEDYDIAAVSANIGQLAENTNPGWAGVDVTDQIQTDVNNSNSFSHFRLRFANETQGGDTAGDFVYYEAAENSEGTGNIPELVVEYN